MSATSNFAIKLISSKETFPVRHPVLRAGRPLEDCIFDNDDLESTKHLGLFLNEQLVSVATFLKNKNSQFQEQNQYQLRGMAVLKEYQGYGFGNALLNDGEQLLKTDNVHLLWFNARTMATGFYLKNNYKIFGDPFEIRGIGTHYLMYKTL